MVYFQRINRKYQLEDGTELPTDELLEFAHEINGNHGVIITPFELGDKVYKHPSTLDLDVHPDLPTGTISGFTVSNGTLCAKLEGDNTPHDVRCLSNCKPVTYIYSEIMGRYVAVKDEDMDALIDSLRKGTSESFN